MPLRGDEHHHGQEPQPRQSSSHHHVGALQLSRGQYCALFPINLLGGEITPSFLTRETFPFSPLFLSLISSSTSMTKLRAKGQRNMRVAAALALGFSLDAALGFNSAFVFRSQQHRHQHQQHRWVTAPRTILEAKPYVSPNNSGTFFWRHMAATRHDEHHPG